MALKIVKFLIAIVVLPFCWGTGAALVEVLSSTKQADTVVVMLSAGAACWLAIFGILPKPMWIYVLGHELTHAVWTWIFGGRVKRLKVTSQGGHVIVTKTNFIITLAPYFFPFYAALVASIYIVGDMAIGWQKYRPIFHLLLGAAYAFHLTLTISILKTRQTDITDQGYLFSAVIIWLGNTIVLLLAMPLLTGGLSIGEAFLRVWQTSLHIYHSIIRW